MNLINTPYHKLKTYFKQKLVKSFYDWLPIYNYIYNHNLK
jgi:hypothetical protein